MLKHVFPLLTAAAYLVTAFIAQKMSLDGAYASVVWPPAGIAIAAIFLNGSNTTFYIFIAAFICNYLASSGDILLAIALSFANTLEGVLGAKSLKRINSFDATFGNTQHVWSFLVITVTLVTLATPIIGTPILYVSGKILTSELIETFCTWWLAHALGVLIFTPFILIVSRDALLVPFKNKELEYGLLAALTAMTCAYLFIDIGPFMLWMPTVFRRIYLLFPLIMWSAVRFGPMGLSFLLLGIAAMATFGASQSSTMFLGKQATETFNSAQLYLAILAATGFLTASNVTQSNRSELKFRSMFEMSGVPAALVDTNGRFKLVNDQFCKMTGYTREELLTKSFQDITHPDDVTSNNESFRKLVAGEDRYLHVEKRYVIKNGDIIWVIIDATLIQKTVGEDITAIAIAQDITTRKLAEMLAETSKRAAEEANHAKTEFLAFMSHEIRTPLGVILGFAELLKNPSLDENLRHDFTSTIHRNAIELGSLIDDMLDMSKVEAGRLDLYREVVDIQDLMRDMRDTFSLEAELKDIELKINIDKNVPLAIKTDHKRLRQILVNIIGNAIKYTPRGTVSITVAKGILEDGKSPSIKFLVEDTGCGISQEESTQIFKPFGQTKRVLAKKIRGTGLGLVLSRKLARLLGGDVVLKKSTTNVGSTFEITIDPGPPVQALGAKFAQAEKQTSIDYQTSARLEGLNILIAEDTPDQAMLINFLLSDLGANVEVVDNGAEAVEKCLKSNFDVILMDMRMPMLDGYDASRILRRSGFNKPIIAVTAQALREEREKAMSAGCNAHLAKPFTQERLLQAIHSSLINKPTTEELYIH